MLVDGMAKQEKNARSRSYATRSLRGEKQKDVGTRLYYDSRPCLVFADLPSIHPPSFHEMTCSI